MNNIIDDTGLFSFMGEDSDSSKKYSKIGIRLNPFPKSGTANINGSDVQNHFLVPFDENVDQKLKQFIHNALSENILDPKDKFICATILGDYGSGKTQLLMYAKFLLNLIAANSHYSSVPYAIYMDNPGISLLEFIGNIISKIGEENLRKYLWSNIIKEICSSASYKSQLNTYLTTQFINFPDQESHNPYAEENTVSYKKFLSSFTNQIFNADKRKKIDQTFQDILTQILYKFTNDTVVSYYFYEFISTDFGVNKTWEALTNGSLRNLKGKEAKIIKYIVQLVKEQGFTDFFILVDEFEDITEGRLTKIQIDNYLYNLRTLLDKHREWCLMFTMTPVALQKLKSISPPLHDRISSTQIILQGLDKKSGISLVRNYMKLANKDSISPFTEEGIEVLLDLVDGNVRRFLKQAYFLIEKLIISKDQLITAEFVKSSISEDE